MLAEEIEGLGFTDVYVDEHAYIYGHIPATPGLEDEPSIALIAHMDTIPDEDFPGTNVKPRCIPNYDGSPIPLGESGRVLDPALFSDLGDCVGHTLIVTDGTTVLGADDKAGIAEILTACEEILTDGLPHGPVSVCFTPDEEIGHGASLLDLDRLGADFAYTVDGGAVEELNAETFNAAGATVTVHGVNVHPGDAKGKMKNASLIAMEFASLLPVTDTPACTEGREGYFHLTGMRGNVETGILDYIIRDHDAQRFAQRKVLLEQAAAFLNAKYGDGTVELSLRDQYRNMAEVLSRYPEVRRRAETAIRAVGLEPVLVPVRGGTDGSQLSFRGLPCPNLGTGGAAFHGPYEHISVQNMEKAVAILKNLLRTA